MRSALVALLVGCTCLASPALAVRRVYVANINANTVAVVDAEARTVLEVIPVGTQPDGVAASPDGATVWVANFGDDSVSVIDTATDTVSATIAVGDGPVGLAMRPGGGEVYVANKLDDSVTVVDTAARAVVATISIRPDTGVNAVAFTPDGRRALVTASFGEKIRLIDPATRQVLDSVRVGGEPNRIAVSPDSRRAYVTLFRGNYDEQGPYSLVAVDLATLQVVARGQADKPTGIAVSPDGGTVYVGDRTGVRRYDAGTLEQLGGLYLAAGVEALAALPAPDVLLLARRERDDILFQAPGFGFDFSGTVTPPGLPLTGGPFALAALPVREPDPLIAAIDAPSFGAKLDTHGNVAVRIRVDDGESALASWTLTLEAIDAPALERTLAAGSAPVAGEVATLDGDGLAVGGTYGLMLDAITAAGAHVVRRSQLTVPDRQYALVPISPSLGGYESRYEMDDAGRRFVRWNPISHDFEVYESDTGLRDRAQPRQGFEYISLFTLSGDGEQAVVKGQLRDGSRLFGTLSLDNLSLSLLNAFPLFLDTDTAGRWIAGTRLGDEDERYRLFDRVTGDDFFISDVVMVRSAVECRPESGNRARISGDGARVAFVTGIDLGFPAAVGCSLFTYDRPSDTLRLVSSFGDASLALPTMDDAGTRFGLVMRPDRRRGDEGQARATLVDLASGARTDLLGDHPAGSSDAALSGDGRSVIISSCADLDPSIGNADANNELFRLDLGTGLLTQITDTSGGSVGCQISGGPAYDPLVSSDAAVLSFVTQDATGSGPQRALRNGFAFGAVRAVRVVDGNTPPKLEIEGETVDLVGEQLILRVRSGDRDVDPISFFAQVGDAGLPEDAAFGIDRNDPQASFFWFLGPEDVGGHTLRLGTFDGRGGETVQDVTLTVCPFFVETVDPDTVAAAIFGLPAACGDADANGDGELGAADLVAVHSIAAR